MKYKITDKYGVELDCGDNHIEEKWDTKTCLVIVAISLICIVLFSIDIITKKMSKETQNNGIIIQGVNNSGETITEKVKLNKRAL